MMEKFVFLLVLLSRAAAESDVVVKPGDDVTLSCKANVASIRAVEWTRPDLETQGYIIFYSDGHSDTTEQLKSFVGRVQLADSELKDGDVSLILKNASINDTGTYDCRVAAGRSGRNKRATKTQSIRSIRLKVTASGSNNGDNMDGNNTRGHVGVGVCALVVFSLAAVGIFVVWVSKRQKDKKSDPSAADKAVDDQLI